jgi:hypothetical protein
LGVCILQELSKDYDIAEEWLLNYDARKKQYYSDLGYIRDEDSRPEVFIRTGPGNVVMQKVISLAELDRTENWLITVELVESLFGPKKKMFLAVRREAKRMNMTVNGREVWRTYVQRHYAEEMSKLYNCPPEKFWLSDRAIMYWWKSMIELTRILALKRGCVFAKSKFF